jgi:hypothetical protein
MSTLSLRHEEIRGLFVFGLLAVLASFRIQNSSTNTLMVQFTYGSLNIIPILDNIITLWSLYAFFVVLGLSRDVIGRTMADSFRKIAKIFLQINFLALGLVSIPIGFAVSGERFIYLLLLIALTVIVGLEFQLLFKTRLSPRRKLKSIFTTRNMPFLLALLFLFSTYEAIYYPETWFASLQVSLVFFVVSAVTITIILLLEARKTDDDYYTSDNDYYC